MEASRMNKRSNLISPKGLISVHEGTVREYN